MNYLIKLLKLIEGRVRKNRDRPRVGWEGEGFLARADIDTLRYFGDFMDGKEF